MSMPKLTSDGYRITVIQMFDPESFTSLTYARLFTIQCDYRLYNEDLTCGEIGICDMEAFKPNHYAKLFDVTYLQLVKLCLTHFPYLIKHLLVFNCHPLLEKGITLCKSILPKKIADRVSVVTRQNITEFVRPEDLPEEFGGTAPSLRYLKGLWIKSLVKERKFFEKIGDAKPTGTIPKEFQSSENEFGIDGSFRNYIFSMPKLTPEGYRINIFRIFDPESYNSFLIARYGILHCDYKLHKDCLVAGEIGIFDLENFKPVHYAKMFDVTSLKSIIFASTYPFLIKHSFVMNCHPLLENGITLCKSMLPKKIADRISMVTLQNITDFVQPEYLPDDYGGTQRSLEYLKDAWIKEFVKEKDFLVGIGEGKPTGPMPKELETCDNEFGIHGSFRKLNID